MKEGAILNFLRENKESFVSGEAISDDLGVSRSAVWKEIQNLRSCGYEIEAAPHLGYRLLSIPDKLFQEEISAGLSSKVIGRQILSYETLDSTNDTCSKLGEQGVPEGVCVFAEHQKKGRGRLGRSWVSPKGKDILFSVLLRPLMLPAQMPRLTLVAALSVVRTIRGFTGKDLGIKWPNDIFYKNLKVGGILTEMSAETDRVKFVVLGIGLNVNSDAKELPPRSASLREISGKRWSRIGVAQELLRALDRDYARLKARCFEELAAEWEEYSVTSGRRVQATVMGRKIQGLAQGIDAEGALWIRNDSGLQERIVAGDVEMIR